MGEIRVPLQRTLGAAQRFMRAIEPAQRRSVIGEERHVVGSELKHPVIGIERFRHAIEFEQRVGAIAKRIAVIGRRHEDTVKAFQRVARSAKLHERDTAPVEQFGIVRRDAKTLVVTNECALKISQRVKNEAKAGKAVGARQIAFQRRLDERERRIEPPAPIGDLPEAAERVEIVWLMLQQLGVEPLRFVKLAVALRPLRAPQHSRQVRLQVLRRLRCINI